MDCPNCGTWNPEDKDVCWRCQTEMPRPVEKKSKNKRQWAGFPLWMWIALIAFFAVTVLGQCFFPAVPGA